MYVVTWLKDGEPTWEPATSRALAESLAARRSGEWLYVAV